MKKAMRNVKKFLKKYSPLIKFLITIFLITIILRKVDLIESIKLLKNITLLILIPFLLYVPALMIGALKWEIALERKEEFWKLFKIYWISGFFSNFLPSTIGGDSYKIFKLRKKLGTRNVLESIIFDRFSGVLGIILISSVFSGILFKTTNNLYLSLSPIFLLIGFCLLLIFIHFFSLNNFKFVLNFKKSLIKFNKKLFLLIPLSMLFLILGAISLWIYYFMFGYSLNFLIVLAFYCVIQFINMIPISINSIGLREGSMIYLFGLLGVSAEISLSIALLSRIIMIFQTSIGGIIYLSQRKNNP